MNGKYKIALIGDKWYVIRKSGYVRILCSPFKDVLEDICTKLNTNSDYTEKDAQLEYQLFHKIKL